MTCPRKKSHFSQGGHLPFIDILRCSTVFSLPICSRMLTHHWTKISSDFICIYETIAGSWVPRCTSDLAGGGHDAPSDPKSYPMAVALAAYDSCLQCSPGLRCPNYGLIRFEYLLWHLLVALQSRLVLVRIFTPWWRRVCRLECPWYVSVWATHPFYIYNWHNLCKFHPCFFCWTGCKTEFSNHNISCQCKPTMLNVLEVHFTT